MTLRPLFLLLVLLPSSSALDNTFLRLSPQIVEKRSLSLNVAPEERAAALRKAFQEAGCPVAQITEQKVPGSPIDSVICTVPGTEPGTLVVSAPIDYRSKGDELGVESATLELLPLLVQSLGGSKRRLTIAYVAFTGGKKQEGSKYYLSQLSDEQKKNIRGMVFLDHLGRSPLRYLHPSQWNNPGVDQLFSNDPFGATASVGSPGRNSAHDPTALNKWLDVSARAMKLDYPFEMTEFYFTHALTFEHQRIKALTLTSPAYMTIIRPRGEVKMPATALDMPTYYEAYSLLCVYLVNLDAQLQAK